MGRRNGDDREVHRLRDVRHARVCCAALNLGRGWMHRDDRSGEARRDQIVENLRTNLAPFSIGADHGDNPRFEEGLHGRGRRELRALRGSGGVVGRRLERQLDAVDPRLDPARHREAGVDEELHHLPVIAQHVGVEDANAVGTSDVCQTLEQPCADAATLQGIGDGEGHLGTLGDAIVAGERDDPSAALTDQRAATGAIAGQQPPNALLIELWDAEETLVAALRRQAVEERQNRAGILATRLPKRER